MRSDFAAPEHASRPAPTSQQRASDRPRPPFSPPPVPLRPPPARGSAKLGRLRSNGSRNRLWKYRIQQFANRHGLTVTVCHFPPGTSKWNKVEHRLFSQISVTWRGEPLVSYETIINFISSTTTKTGLKVKAELDTHEYETGKKITDEQMRTVTVKPHKTHPVWNYTIHNHI